jgi:hypothetical protein
MDLDEGLAYLENQGQRRIEGFWVESATKMAATRLKMFAMGQTKCVGCGLQGDHFHIERHKNDKVMPFSINLYGWKDGREVMLTWDHILPKSLGGSNRIENAQCMCKHCNERKSNKLSIDEIVDIVSHEHAEKMYKMDQPLPKGSLKQLLDVVNAETEKFLKGRGDE